MPDDPKMNRRHFFRQGLGELLTPLAKSLAPMQEVLKQFQEIEAEVRTAGEVKDAKPPANAILKAANTTPIRPPGALAEREFQITCSKCGDCVAVCPVQCIQMDLTGEKHNGLPYIDVDTNPCVLCDGLKCMHSCPTGALVPTAIADIDMGTAVWNAETCIRPKGEDCSLCVEKCPIGEVAIRVDGQKIHVIEDGCTGCGCCQNICPTSPKSIAVSPKEGVGPVGRTRRW